jgi:hypothetical protein
LPVQASTSFGIVPGFPTILTARQPPALSPATLSF